MVDHNNDASGVELNTPAYMAGHTPEELAAVKFHRHNEQYCFYCLTTCFPCLIALRMSDRAGSRSSQYFDHNIAGVVTIASKSVVNIPTKCDSGICGAIAPLPRKVLTPATMVTLS